VLHRSAMKPRAHEAALSRRQDLSAAVGLGLHIGAAHREPFWTWYCGAVNENERSFSKRQHEILSNYRNGSRQFGCGRRIDWMGSFLLVDVGIRGAADVLGQ